MRAASPPLDHFVPEAGGPGCQPVLERSPRLWARRNPQGAPEAGSRQNLSGSAATGRTDHCRVKRILRVLRNTSVIQILSWGTSGHGCQ